MSEMSFLDGYSPAEPEITPEIQAPEPEITDIVPEPEAPEPAPAAQPVMVPVHAVQEERAKRQALEAELAALRAAQQQPVEMPDPEYDPAAYTQAVSAQLQAQVQNDRLNLSEDFARQKHGDDAVEEAKQWALQQAATRPGFQQEILSNRNPYEFVVQAYRKDQIASKITDPNQFEQFLAWQQAQAQQAALTAPVATPVTPPSRQAPPRSQVATPSAGGAAAVPTGPGQAFDKLF